MTPAELALVPEDRLTQRFADDPAAPGGLRWELAMAEKRVERMEAIAEHTGNPYDVRELAVARADLAWLRERFEPEAAQPAPQGERHAA